MAFGKFIKKALGFGGGPSRGEKALARQRRIEEQARLKRAADEAFRQRKKQAEGIRSASRKKGAQSDVVLSSLTGLLGVKKTKLSGRS